MIKEFAELAREKDAYQAALAIAEKSGIINEFKNPKTIQEQNKYENIQEILNGIKDFTERYEGEEVPTLEHYIENVSLLTDADQEDEEDLNKVTIMTMHSAKGLEFRNVYLAGMEEGLFPSKMSMNTDKELEEERRLFYVALTRAEEKAVLSYANSRYKWGVSTRSQPSRFIYDIDPRYMILPEVEPQEESADEPARSRAPSSASTSASAGFSADQANRNLTKIGSRPKNQTAAGGPPEYNGSLKVGMWVQHDRFGKGEITNLETDAPNNTKATIEFTDYGKKQLLLKFAKLKIISG
jgi:DNA helicase-2/ATP-dependent DNA helicase PcrA